MLIVSRMPAAHFPCIAAQQFLNRNGLDCKRESGVDTNSSDLNGLIATSVLCIGLLSVDERPIAAQLAALREGLIGNPGAFNKAKRSMTMNDLYSLSQVN